jgi:arylsulfatase
MNKTNQIKESGSRKNQLGSPFRSLVCLSALLGTQASFQTGLAAEKPAAHPNIVIILADDMGYSDIGCYGSEIATPNLDALAKEGLRFSQFYNTSRCCPSRAALLTGLYSHEAGVGDMLSNTGFPGYSDGLREDTVTIPEVLKSAGYATFMAGKWHVGWSEAGSPLARGFDHFYGSRGYVDSYYSVMPVTDIYLDNRIVIPAGTKPVNQLHPDQEWYTTDVYTDYALHFLDGHFARTNGQPFFLYLAYNAPHWPLHAKPEDLAKYRGKYLKQGWNDLRAEHMKRMVKAGLLDPREVLSDRDAPDWNSLSEGVKDEMDLKMAIYAAIVDRLDQNVGRVVRYLKAHGAFDNTLIVFLSDNGGNREGGMFGYHEHDANPTNYPSWAKEGGRSASYGQAWANVSNTPFRLYKCWEHEGGISSPCIFHWPDGGLTNGITHQVAHIIDLMPTLAEIAGAMYPKVRDGHPVQSEEGKSLVPGLYGGTIGPRTLFWEHEGNRAVREGNWKLVALSGEPWELYDVSHDRSEMVNVIGQHPELAQKIEADWQAWADRAKVLPWKTVLAKMPPWETVLARILEQVKQDQAAGQH